MDFVIDITRAEVVVNGEKIKMGRYFENMKQQIKAEILEELAQKQTKPDPSPAGPSNKPKQKMPTVNEYGNTQSVQDGLLDELRMPAISLGQPKTRHPIDLSGNHLYRTLRRSIDDAYASRDDSFDEDDAKIKEALKQWHGRLEG